MPSATITRASPVVRSPRVQQIEAMFDVPPTKRAELTWEIDLPIETDDWNVGLIVGPSGSGKTTIAREMFSDALVSGFEWQKTKSLLDSFPKGMPIKAIVGLLTAVGFGSPPAWLRPFHVLSNGEQFRATIARAMAETTGLIAVDEFTSVVDRQVAKVASHAVQKAIRRAKRKLVALSCHYDVVDWLQPDWIYQPHTRNFARRRLRRHPPLELKIHPVDRSVWEVFKQHHYLSSHLHGAANVVGAFIGAQCVAFGSWRKLPNNHASNLAIAHRLVVLPDYQGLGIGGRLNDWIGGHLYRQGKRYFLITAHPAMIYYCLLSPRWKLRRAGRGMRSRADRIMRPASAKCSRQSQKDLRGHQFAFNAQRCSCSFLYIPPAN